MHSSAVTALDWSRDSRYVRAIDQAYGKQYHDVVDGSVLKEGAEVLTDPALWESISCKLGWDTSGCFPPGADGTDINNVAANANRTILAAADDFGSVCFYKYPCMKQ